MAKEFAKAYIQITEFCGLNCSFCEPKKFKTAQMSLPLFEKINKELYKKTKTVAYHVLGDPLTVENLRDYLDLSLKYGHAVELTTSGFYSLEDEGVLFHDAVRQINLSLSSQFVNRKKNSLDDYMGKIFDFCDKSAKKPRRFINLRLWNIGDARYSQFNEEVESLISKRYGNSDFIRGKTRFTSYAVLVKDRVFEWPSLQKERLFKTGGCLAISSQIGFLTDGTVVPCCLDANGDISLGNVAEKTLDEILNSKKAIDIANGFKNNIRIEGLCQTCSF